MTERKASRGEAVLFVSLLASIATGLTTHGLGYRLSLVLGLSIFAFLLAIFIVAQLVE
jgi:heme A synthase